MTSERGKKKILVDLCESLKSSTVPLVSQRFVSLMVMYKFLVRWMLWMRNDRCFGSMRNDRYFRCYSRMVQSSQDMMIIKDGPCS